MNKFSFDLQLFALSDLNIDTNLTQQAWADELWTSAQKDLYFAKFIGDSEDFIIQKKNQLGKEAGDHITVPLIARLIAPGITGDNTLTGNEEPYAAYDFPVYVDQIAKSIRLKGKMSQQKTKYSMRKTAKTLLTQWMQEYMDQQFFNVLSTSPTTNRVVYAGGRASDSLIQTGDIMTVSLISKAKRKATMAGQPVVLSTSGGTVTTSAAGFTVVGSGTAFTTDFFVGDLITIGTQANYIVSIASATSLSVAAQWNSAASGVSYSAIRYNGARSKLRPVVVDGHKFFVAVIHPWQERDLRTDPDWIGAQESFAAWRGYDNPIFKGGIGLIDGVIVHTHENVSVTQDGVSSGNVGHALLMGAQAGCMAVAQEPDWVEDPLQDFQRQPGFATSMIWGVAKSNFNGEDFAVVQIATSAVSD